MPPPSSEPTPLVFAHRGSSAALPEHTLGAYLRAIEEGADGLECDVRLTRDGHLVCLHDRRLERTSDGRGRVSDHTLAELADLDFGSRHPGWPDSADEFILDRADGTGAAEVLTLDRLLSAARAAARPVRLLIETKHPTRYGTVIEERVAALLRRYRLDLPEPGGVSVAVMSFSVGALRRMRRLAPAVPTVLLMAIVPPWLRDGRLPAGVDIAGPSIRLLGTRPLLAGRLHGQGHQVYAWTVNTPAEVDLALASAADGVITDRPRYVLDRLGR